MTLMIPKPAPIKRDIDRCPHPEKHGSWPTWELAEAARIKQIGEMVSKGRDNSLPTRAYLCPCRFWHLTSQVQNSRLKERQGLISAKVSLVHPGRAHHRKGTHA